MTAPTEDRHGGASRRELLAIEGPALAAAATPRRAAVARWESRAQPAAFEAGGDSISTLTTKDGTQIYSKGWGPRDGKADTFSHGWPLLAEFGTVIPHDVQIVVSDSTAAVRYLVLPRRPEGTAGFTEGQLAALVTRDSMIGVIPANSPSTTGIPKGELQ